MPDPDCEKLKKSIEGLVQEYGSFKLEIFIKIFESSMIRAAIAQSKTYNAAAEKLGISKSTMYRKMREYEIPKKRTNHLARGKERNVSGVADVQEGVHGGIEGDRPL